MDSPKIPCIICSSENDLQYLFEYSLETCLKNTDFLAEVFIITPNNKLATKIISAKLSTCNIPIHVIKDNELLSKKESKMCGWSKQQILKLRSYEITKNENILSVGADTVILKKLYLSRLYSPENIIVNYRKHKPESKHFNFEINRAKSIYTLLAINTARQEEYLRDFIFDIFLFNSYVLIELNIFLKKKFGTNCFLKMFPRHVNGYIDMEKIGEWTLYTLFAIEILNHPFILQNGTAFLHQIHTEIELGNYDYQNEAVHFVRKDFDKTFIFNELKKHKLL